MLGGMLKSFPNPFRWTGKRKATESGSPPSPSANSSQMDARSTLSSPSSSVAASFQPDVPSPSATFSSPQSPAASIRATPSSAASPSTSASSPGSAGTQSSSFTSTPPTAKKEANMSRTAWTSAAVFALITYLYVTGRTTLAVGESRESRDEGALYRASEWINASNAANTADSNCNSTPETCITKIRSLQKTKSPATGHEYGVDEKGFNQLLEDMGISKEQREKSKPLSPQDQLLNNTLQREKRNLQALENLITKHEGTPGTSESLLKDLKEHVNKRRDYLLSGEYIGRSQAHELDSKGDVGDELIKTLFRGKYGQNREPLLQDLAAELADSKCPTEKKTGSLLNHTLEGVRALERRNLPNIITPLVESAAQNADRWLRWPIMPWCIDDWLRRMNAKCSHAYNSHPNGIWKRFSHCFFNIIGAGNPLLFANGPRHQVGLTSCIYVLALTCPASQELLTNQLEILFTGHRPYHQARTVVRHSGRKSSFL